MKVYIPAPLSVGLFTYKRGLSESADGLVEVNVSKKKKKFPVGDKGGKKNERIMCSMHI